MNIFRGMNILVDTFGESQLNWTNLGRFGPVFKANVQNENIRGTC